MIGKKYLARLHRVMMGVSFATVAVLAAPSTASAQGGAAGFAELNIHDYLHRDIVLFAQALEMDEGQRVIVESLYEDYRATFDAGWARTQQRFTEMRDELAMAARDQVMNLVLAPIENWQREKVQIKQQFEQNVKVILNPVQLERWPAFERQMLREKTLHSGRLSGESLNLFHVLRDLRLSERLRMQIDPTVERYDLSLHEALQQRNAALAASQQAMMRSIRSQETGANLARIRHEVERRIAVRNVNDQFIEEIAAVLPQQYAEEFRRDALERAYPRVFRPLPAERVFDEALRLELDEQMLAQIASWRAAMLEEFAAINARLHGGMREHEPKAMINQAEMAAARQSGDSVERLVDPNLEHFRHRDERAHYYMTQLREFLGTEQFAALPGASRWVPQRRAEVHHVDPPQPTPTRDGRLRGTRGADNSGLGTPSTTSPSDSPQ